jgi:large subunit ribosomal protein L10
MREKKQLLLDEIKEKIEESRGFVALNYRSFTAAKARQFRDSMAEIGGEFEVVRKRVFVKAAESVGIQFHIEKLQGHVGIVFARQDVTQIIKGAMKFSEENDHAVTFLGGHVDGVVCSAEEVDGIAKLPGIQELRAQFVGLLAAPMSQSVQVLQAVLTNVLYCLEEKGKKG